MPPLDCMSWCIHGPEHGLPSFHNNVPELDFNGSCSASYKAAGRSLNFRNCRAGSSTGINKKDTASQPRGSFCGFGMCYL